jgi:hypothetical protein
MYIDEKTISLFPTVEYPYIDEVTSDIFEEYGLPRLGGASGRGWSSFATIQRCPHLYKVTYLDRFRGTPGKALEVGSIMHTLLALYYSWMVDDNWKLTPEIMKNALMQRGARPESVIEGWRLFDAYQNHYTSDYIYPIAQEVWAQDPDGNTCRYDLIARVVEDQPGIPAGIFNIEHKSAARFSQPYLDGWRNDGEVIGQMMIWKRSGLDEKYGELKGTIVNIIGKQKVPLFHRTIIPLEAWHVSQHAQDLKMWTAIRNMYEASGFWPKSRTNCTNKYGTCQIFDSCASNQEPKTIDQLIQISLDKTVKAAAEMSPNDTEADD